MHEKSMLFRYFFGAIKMENWRNCKYFYVILKGKKTVVVLISRFDKFLIY